MRDHDPYAITDFAGFWSRGDNDSCPKNYQTELINYLFEQSAVRTRDGLSGAKATASSVLRFYPYPDSGPGDGFIVLMSDNKIYHIYGGISFGVPSFTIFQVSNAIATMTDFGFVSVNGRAYISPSINTNLNGVPGEFIYVYDGTGVNMMRKAAGTAPTTAEGALAAALSATAGNVETGIHVFGVVYETNSGFLTQIGPDTLATVTADGAHKVSLTAIPIFGGGGGTLITKRHIVASKLIAPGIYTGDAKSYQLFFVPNGTISNNTATILTVNFYDSELIEDASHLLDLKSELPACGGLGMYHSRMLAWDSGTVIGPDGDGINVVLVSYAGEPEAFDAVNGLLVVPREGTGITYCQEYRDVLYVMKFDKLMSFNDNGDVPTSWPSAVIDQGLGCGKHGISSVGLYGGTNVESFIALNVQGVYVFSGLFNTPELSYAIRDYWQSITPLNIIIGAVSAYTDPQHQRLYIVIPEFSTILVGDYSDGLNADKIRWSKWTFGAVPSSIVLFDKDNKLMIGMPTGIHWIQVGATSDTIMPSAAVKIPNPTFTTALVPTEQETSDDNILHYGGARLRVTGSGNLIPTYSTMDGNATSVLATIVLSTTPGREPFVLANVISQRARLQLQTTVINETVRLSRVTIYTRAMYTSYPA